LTTAYELRELAVQIEQLARDSPVWSIVHEWVRTLTDHLAAVARVHETRRLCEECGKYPADEPSRLCPGCEAEQDILEAAIKLGERHLHDKINLLDLIERALAQMKRGRVNEARKFLERAVREVGDA
jgi:hypothetical protein